jgi:hypothetical protein
VRSELDESDDAVRFCAAHEAALDARRAIWDVYRLDDPVDLGDDAAVRTALDRLAAALGYNPPGATWRSIDEPHALQALEVLVRFEQVYETRIVSDAAASSLVADFAALFPATRSWHTTASFVERPTRIDDDETVPLLVATGWYGFLTGATFDTGIAVVSSRRIGLLWFSEED